MWHIDSYDKLTPHGLGINGCVDVFSRYILWAEVYHTNSDPAVIGNYYLNAVQSLNGCPAKIRVDAGTENVNINLLQDFLIDNEDLNATSVITGSSTRNIRIESWFAQYRKCNAEYYISLFHLIQSDGDFTGDMVDKELIRFCFLNIIQVKSIIYYILF